MIITDNLAPVHSSQMYYISLGMQAPQAWSLWAKGKVTSSSNVTYQFLIGICLTKSKELAEQGYFVTVAAEHKIHTNK